MALNASLLNPDLAARFADLALANVVREYPNKQDHVLGAAGDAQPTRLLHPSFYGSYDWHSCVHMHWLLARLRRGFPALPQRAAIDALFDRHFAPEAIAGECAYLARPGTQSFERTYGWAWLLKLATELLATEDERAPLWAANLAPLASAFVARYRDLPAEGAVTRSATASIRTARSASRLRSTTRGSRVSSSWKTRAWPRRRRGTAPIATPRRRGSLPAPISCRRP